MGPRGLFLLTHRRHLLFLHPRLRSLGSSYESPDAPHQESPHWRATSELVCRDFTEDTEGRQRREFMSHLPQQTARSPSECATMALSVPLGHPSSQGLPVALVGIDPKVCDIFCSEWFTFSTLPQIGSRAIYNPKLTKEL